MKHSYLSINILIIAMLVGLSAGGCNNLTVGSSTSEGSQPPADENGKQPAVSQPIGPELEKFLTSNGQVTSFQDYTQKYQVQFYKKAQTWWATVTDKSLGDNNIRTYDLPVHNALDEKATRLGENKIHIEFSADKQQGVVYLGDYGLSGGSKKSGKEKEEMNKGLSGEGSSQKKKTAKNLAALESAKFLGRDSKSRVTRQTKTSREGLLGLKGKEGIKVTEKKGEQKQLKEAEKAKTSSESGSEEDIVANTTKAGTLSKEVELEEKEESEEEEGSESGPQNEEKEEKAVTKGQSPKHSPRKKKRNEVEGLTLGAKSMERMNKYQIDPTIIKALKPFINISIDAVLRDIEKSYKGKYTKAYIAGDRGAITELTLIGPSTRGSKSKSIPISGQTGEGQENMHAEMVALKKAWDKKLIMINKKGRIVQVSNPSQRIPVTTYKPTSDSKESMENCGYCTFFLHILGLTPPSPTGSPSQNTGADTKKSETTLRYPLPDFILYNRSVLEQLLVQGETEKVKLSSVKDKLDELFQIHEGYNKVLSKEQNEKEEEEEEGEEEEKEEWEKLTLNQKAAIRAVWAEIENQLTEKMK